MTNSTSCLAIRKMAVLPVADGVDDEALGLESGGQKPRDSRLILDDEDAHGRLPGIGDGRKEPLMSFYHGPLRFGLLGDRGVIDGESGNPGIRVAPCRAPTGSMRPTPIARSWSACSASGRTCRRPRSSSCSATT